MGDWVLDGVGVLPCLVLATDVAFAFQSVGVAAVVFASVVAGSLLRAAAPVVAGLTTLSFHSPMDVGYLLIVFDRFLIPVVMTVGTCWPSYYAGATVVVLFFSTSLRRHMEIRQYLPIAALVLFFISAIIAGSSGLDVAQDTAARWTTQKGWAVVPCISLFILVASRPLPPGGKAGMDRIWAEVAIVLATFLIGRYFWALPNSKCWGMQFLGFGVADSPAAIACRVFLFLAASVDVSVWLSPGSVGKKDESFDQAKLRLERELLSIASVSVIFVPLLALCPFVLFPLFALFFRVVALSVVYKSKPKAYSNAAGYSLLES